MGRPTALTPTMIDRIVDAVEKGLAVTRAVQMCGFSENSYSYWQKRAMEGAEPYATLIARVREADARGEMKLVEIVQAAAVTDAKHAQWMLERRHKWWVPRDSLPVSMQLPPAPMPDVSASDVESTLRGKA